MTELLAICLILVAALVLRAVVSYVLQRLSVFPDDPSARSNGAEDVIDWLRRRRGASDPDQSRKD
ncbi:MAG: hypothetical protein R2849_02990 [Thermomicrobiales bacterium]